jgi:RNA polymerase sigma-70 factor (ECF subfamily)
VIRNGDTPELEKLLHKDIVVVSDGGGKAIAFRKIVSGIRKVAKLLIGLMQKYYAGRRIEQGTINHQPALFYYEGGELATVQIFSIENDRLKNIYFMRNPDKLKTLKEIL